MVIIVTVEAIEADVEKDATEAADDADAPPRPDSDDTPADDSAADVEADEGEEVAADESFLRVETRPRFSNRTLFGFRDCAKMDRYMD